MTATLAEQARDSLTLRQRAERAVTVLAERHAQHERERAERERENNISALVHDLKRRLDVDVDRLLVAYDVSAPHPYAHATVMVDGLTFAIARLPYRDGDKELCVRIACSRGCHEVLWQHVYSLQSLHEALTGKHSHTHDCLVIYDENGDAVTDRDGKPLPPRNAKPEPTTDERLAEIIREVVRDELANQGVGI